jgi:hypothetical protein
MKAKPTQTEAVKQTLVNGLSITGSSAYQLTKKMCGIGTLNLHKIIAALRGKGLIIQEYWADGHTHKVFMLDKRKTPKKLLK